MNHAIKAMTLSVVAILATGCVGIDGLPDKRITADRPNPPSEAGYLRPTSIKTPNQEDSETAVENALVWAEKHAKVVEKLVKAQQECRQLTEKNRLQAAELEVVRQQLKQAQKELSEANAMLMEMQAELEKWKTDVLGFRNEMKKAQETQMIALRKVLKLLGGEIGEDLQTASNEGKGTSQ